MPVLEYLRLVPAQLRHFAVRPQLGPNLTFMTPFDLEDDDLGQQKFDIM